MLQGERSVNYGRINLRMKPKNLDVLRLADKGLFLLAWAGGVAAFVQIVRLTLAAAIFPLELELREGYSWLFVLVMKAGHNIYDHSAVAMLSQHYGPLEPVLKYWLSVIFPFASSQVITRFFVPLLPLSLVYMSFAIFKDWGKWRWPFAFLGGSAAFMAFINLHPFNGLAGRTDVLACFFVALQAAALVESAGKKQLRKRDLIWPALLPTLVFLTNSRCAPVCGTVWLVHAAHVFMRDRRLGWFFLAGSVGGLSAFIVSFVILQFGGSFYLFYQHFIGVQISSGLVPATNAAPAFSLFPAEILGNWYRALPIYGVFAAAGLVAIAVPNQRLGRRLSWAAWALCGLAYVVIDVAYQFNFHGGGVHYFDPLLVQLFWLYLLFLSGMEQKWRHITVGGLLLLYTALVPDWKQVQFHLDEFATHHQEALRFRNAMSALYDRGEIMSEGIHLYKNQMGNTLVEGMDVIEPILATGYFGETFNNTARKFQEMNASGRYPFFVDEGIVSPTTMKSLMEKGYQPIAQGPPYSTWNGPGGCVSQLNCILVLKRP